MNDLTGIDPLLVDYLSRSLDLKSTVARRCIAEVLAFYRETAPDFVQRRHRELQAEGRLRNPAIYAQIAAEVAERPFAVAPLSDRQVRRLIYG